MRSITRWCKTIYCNTGDRKCDMNWDFDDVTAIVETSHCVQIEVSESYDQNAYRKVSN